VSAFERGPVRIRIDLPVYEEESELSDEQRTELLSDLRA
jgi:hypothetical protein